MGILSAIFRAFGTGTRHKAAWNALVAHHTFDQLSSDQKDRVFAKVEEIESIVHRRPTTFLDVVARTDEVQRSLFFALAMNNLGIPPAVDRAWWYPVRNPYGELSVDSPEIEEVRLDLQKRFGLTIRLGTDVETGYDEQDTADLQDNIDLDRAKDESIAFIRELESEPHGEFAHISFDETYIGPLKKFCCPECKCREGHAYWGGIDDYEIGPSDEAWRIVEKSARCMKCYSTIPLHLASPEGPLQEANAAREWLGTYRNGGLRK